MAWDHLSINKPHLVYIVLGGFTTLFMLCSTVIKERLYIGEATVATICGVIFGPHAADLIDPSTWGNTDQITIEFSRIVLVVQCFAVGVELPRAYMERHWRSVVFLLVPVMTFGWLMTSLFIWAVLYHRLSWLDSLVIAACVTATDPVLASSVVGKGKFAKRVPKHLRDLLSAESGCNDGMAFPFVYLAVYLEQYRPDANAVSLHWFCITILYECIFGAVYGVTIGYLARRAVRYAHERDLIDRESFLVFYFVLALFCAGSGSILGVDDLLVGFAAGVGFSNDGWFLEKTEESHVSNVIDLLINLAFFVYLGTIIPWAQYNDPVLGLSPWRLVVLALLVLFFRRIPIMLALKPVIPDIKTWREALFAGHFGPIGVGAIFVAILARAEMEGDGTEPLATLPGPNAQHANIVYLVWPVVTFLVIASILVHGSSIAVFTLGKHINTLTITMSYTQATDENNWMDRLPRIQSRSRTSMSKRSDASDDDLEEKLPEYPAAALGLPRNFLRRQKEGETPSRSSSRPGRRRRRISGGPVEESAIRPRPRKQESDDDGLLEQDTSPSDTLAMQSEDTSLSKEDELEKKRTKQRKVEYAEQHPDIEVYEEGSETIIEDHEGNVLEVMKSREGESEQERRASIGEEVERLRSDEQVENGVAKKEQGIQSGLHWDEVKRNFKDHDTEGQEGNELEGHGHPPSEESKKKSKRQGEGEEKDKPAEDDNKKRPHGLSLGAMGHRMMSSIKPGHDKEGPHKEEPTKAPAHNPKRGPARAYRFGRTIIVEDEDGEVIKQYDIPAPEGKPTRFGSYTNPDNTRQRLTRMGTWLGIKPDEAAEVAEPSSTGTPGDTAGKGKQQKDSKVAERDNDDDRIRFTMEGQTRRLNKADLISALAQLDPKARAKIVEQTDLPDPLKEEVRADAVEHDKNKRRASAKELNGTDVKSKNDRSHGQLQKVSNREDRSAGPEGLALVDSNEETIPFHSFTSPEARQESSHSDETPAQRRRRQAGRTVSSSSGYFSSRAPATTQTFRTISEDQDGEAASEASPSLPPSASRDSPAKARTRSESDSSDGSRIRHMRHLTASPEMQRQPTATRTSSDLQETAAERRRREAALGVSKEDSDTESESETERGHTKKSTPKKTRKQQDAQDILEEEDEEPDLLEDNDNQESRGRTMGIRFADPHPREKAKKSNKDNDNSKITDPPSTEERGTGVHHTGLGTKLRWAAGLGKKK